MTDSNSKSFLPTKQLLKLHRYAGLIAAPLILFFAISGIWQVFRLQDDKKDGYKAPKILHAASEFHMAEGMGRGSARTVFRTVITIASVVLAFAAGIGIILGLRITRPRWMATLLLILGIAVPLLLYILAKGTG